MTPQNVTAAAFIHAFPLIFLTHAIANYSERVKSPRSIKEQVFLETELHGLKQAIKHLYN